MVQPVALPPVAPDGATLNPAEALKTLLSSTAEEQGGLLTQLAATDQSTAWQVYQQLRAGELAVITHHATQQPPAAESGVVTCSAFTLRRCVASVEKQALSTDVSLLQSNFQQCGALPALLDALYLQQIGQLAQRTVADAAYAYAANPCSAAVAATTSSFGADSASQRPASAPTAKDRRRAAAATAAGTVAPPTSAAAAAAAAAAASAAAPSVGWPAIVRESNAACDALSGLSAALTAAAPSQLSPASLTQLERSAALQPSEAVLVQATRTHLNQLLSEALAVEMSDGPMRSGWVSCVTSSGKPSYVLGSCATILSSLKLHASGAAYGVLPALDAALCTELASLCAAYAAHAGALCDASGLVVKGLTAAGRAPSFAASLTPALSKAAADRALPMVCVASVVALRRALEKLQAGSRLGTSTSRAVPPLEWSDEACAAKIAEAVRTLVEAERRLSASTCDTVATLACTAAIDAVTSDFWSGLREWRGGVRCSLPVQLCLLQLHTAKYNLDALGDPALCDLLFARVVRRCMGRMVRAYWKDINLAEGRMLTFTRDVHVLLALAYATSDLAADGAADAANAPADARERAAASAAAAAAAGVGPPAVEDATLEVERGRIGQLALWLLSLLALHAAPLPLLCGFVQGAGESFAAAASAPAAAPAAAAPASGSSAPSSPRREAEWGQVGVESLPQISPPALAALSALNLPGVAAPAHGLFKPVYDTEKAFMKAFVRPVAEISHAKLQEAAQAPMPDSVDWAAVLSWEGFPIRGFPTLVRHALRRHPALQPRALSIAQQIAAKEPVRGDLPSRNELIKLLGM